MSAFDEHGAEAAPVKSSIGRFVLLATLLAIAVACAIGVLIGDEVTTPATYARGGSNYDGIIEFSVAGAIALVCAVLCWLVFYVLIFRKRAKLWKSFVALLIMVIAVAVIAVPVRIGTLVAHYMADSDDLRTLREESKVRRRALRDTMAPNLDGLRMDQGGPEISRVQDITDHRTHLLEALTQMRAYHAAVNLDLEQSRDAIQALDVYSSVKEDEVAWYSERLEPTSNTQRHLTATEQILEKGAALLTYLLEHRSAWIIEDGRISIIDRAVYDEVARRHADLDYIGGDLDHLQGAMGLELQEAPEEEAPSPQ